MANGDNVNQPEPQDKDGITPGLTQGYAAVQDDDEISSDEYAQLLSLYDSSFRNLAEGLSLIHI